MTYEQGFSDGERAAWHDRKVGVARPMPQTQDEYRRGYLDGYTPRSPTWEVRRVDRPVIEWWRESEAA